MLKFSRNNKGSVFSLSSINGDDQRPGCELGSSSSSGGIADNIEYPSQPVADKTKSMSDGRNGLRMAGASTFGRHMTPL